jgi:SAM-dependent methyltransferase
MMMQDQAAAQPALDPRGLAADKPVMATDPRRFAPATVRNRDAIQHVLGPRLPSHGLALEIASGSGEHVTHFAQSNPPALVFQPSDPAPEARASIDAWVASAGAINVRPALDLDASAQTWPIDRADAILCINMIHISHWAATEGLIRGAARLLPPDGLLYLYGPYRRGGRHTAPSNASFDEELRHQNAAWGVRNLEDVTALAGSHGFGPPEIVEMPANNLSLIFRRLHQLPE